MKNLITMLFAFVISIFAYADGETTIKNIHIDVPCKLRIVDVDTTTIITYNDTANIIYKIKGDTLYIKPRHYEEYNGTEILPVIRVYNNGIPTIKTNTSFQIVNDNRKTKRNDYVSKN